MIEAKRETAGFKCDSCGASFPEDRGDCYSCGSEHLSPIPKLATSKRCELCGGSHTQEHHLSYFPEETMRVCTNCHVRIHREDGFRDDLQPEQKRPENYERKLRDWESKHDPHYFTCASCEDSIVAGDAYLIEVGSGSTPEPGDRVRCFKCTGAGANG